MNNIRSKTFQSWKPIGNNHKIKRMEKRKSRTKEELEQRLLEVEQEVATLKSILLQLIPIEDILEEINRRGFQFKLSNNQ